MRIKPGVRVAGLRPEITLAASIIDSVYREFNTELVITCGIEGKHMHRSLHFAGLAIDCRTFNVDADLHSSLLSSIQTALGDDYEVILEKDHIHVEFNPTQITT